MSVLRRQIRRATGALRDLSPFLGRSRRLLVVLVVLSAMAGMAQAVALMVVAAAVVALSDGGEVSLELAGLGVSQPVGVAVAVAGAAVVAMVALQLGAAALAVRISTDALTNATISLFGDFLDADWAEQSRERRGHLQELLSTHVAKVSSGVEKLAQLFGALANLLVFLAAVLLIDPLTAVVVIACVGSLSLLLRPLTTQAKRRGAVHARARVALMTTLTERVGLAREIRIYGASEPVREEVAALQHHMAAQQRSMGFITRSVLIAYQGLALGVAVGALAVISSVDAADLAALGAMVLLLLRATSYGQMAHSALHALGEIRPYLESVQMVEASLQAARTPSTGERVERIGSVQLHQASYTYDGDEAALIGIDLGIQPGEMIGVVGPSGSGKSTLVQLLLRLRHPTSGSLLIDGEEADGLDAASWYDHVAYVPQDPQILHGTVADNIRFFREGLDRAAVERAARLAHLHDEIASWPQGYETVLEGHGSGISGGQAQRLCIARALVVPPDLLILDEPTSALDLRSESLIQETLEDLAGTTTMVIIAHRITTIRRCDRIAVLEDGRLAAYERPEVLAADEGFFRRALDLSTSSADDLPGRSVS